jgi:hypothetical protein
MSFKNSKYTKTTDYFSDDEVKEQECPDIINDYPYEDDQYEMDNETKQIIFASLSKNINKYTNDLDELIKIENKTKNNNQNIKIGKKQKNVFNLTEFNKKIDEEEKAKKPKKFVSKRADDKRKQLGIDENIGPKRSFNPRKPPYNFVKSHNKKDEKPNILNENDFPSL